MSDYSIEKIYYTRHANEVIEHKNFDMDLNEIYFGHVPSLIFVERSTSAIIITKKVGNHTLINNERISSG